MAPRQPIWLAIACMPRVARVARHDIDLARGRMGMAFCFPDCAPEVPYYCVVGTPIAHSRSPEIHQAFGGELGISLRYDRIEVAAGGLAKAVQQFRELGGCGMNVTVPLKEEAWELAAWRAPRAESARAANTLWFAAGGALKADNTDGVGLVRDLELNLGIGLEGKSILLLGAGGAARGVLPSLLAAGPRELNVSNRTLAKAEGLRDSMLEAGRLGVVPWGEAPRSLPDVIVNATALSLAGKAPPLPDGAFAAHTVCYDMMYGRGDTVFLAWAREKGVLRAYDGLGMLVEQAAEAFSIWHGKRPSTAPIIASMRG